MLIESTIRNIGIPIRCRKLSASLMSQIATALGKDYPAESSTYRLGDLIVLFPLAQLPGVLADCDWSVAVNVETNEPLAAFPDIDASTAYDLRGYLCSTAKAPVVFYHRPSCMVYMSYMHHDWTIGTWFSLDAHNFIRSDSNFEEENN